ncbi:hypothetical protein GCM10010214_09620 [Streptomyces abikoensis]|nr:hypothetical protein GCM10010214_09620 [Streptomyces abikoensis]
MLVGDAGEHRVGAGVRALDQGRGEGGDGAREGLLLAALGLVAAVEQVAQEGRVGGEELVVEERGDVTDRAADGGQGGTDDLGRLRGQHLGLLLRSLNWYLRFVFLGVRGRGGGCEGARV